MKVSRHVLAALVLTVALGAPCQAQQNRQSRQTRQATERPNIAHSDWPLASKLWPVMINGFMPVIMAGTLATGQTPVVLNGRFQQVMESVSSAPYLQFGADYPKKAGYPCHSAFYADGLAQIRYELRSPAQIEVGFAVRPPSGWEPLQQDGVSDVVLDLPAGTGTIFAPLSVAITAQPTNASYHAYDLEGRTLGYVDGTVSIVAATIKVEVWPTNSSVASQPNIRAYIDRSHLLY
jgi:hypothetical protein